MIAPSLAVFYSSLLLPRVTLQIVSIYTEKPSNSRRRRLDNERGGGSRSRSSKMDRRLRRLEKTVEALSHGLIVALTQLKSGDEYVEQRRPDSSPDSLPSAPRPRESHSHAVNDETETVSTGDVVDSDANYPNLSAAIAEIELPEDGRDSYMNWMLRVMSMRAAPGGIDTTASSFQPNNTESTSSLEEDLLRLLRGSQLPSTATETSVGSNGGLENAFSCIATGSDGSLFTTSKEWSPISRMLSPILKFITSSDVSRFLKRAEVHAGLSSTQLFDLFWVLDNLFNVHGGVRFFFSLVSRNRIVLITRYCRYWYIVSERA